MFDVKGIRDCKRRVWAGLLDPAARNCRPKSATPRHRRYDGSANHARHPFAEPAVRRAVAHQRFLTSSRRITAAPCHHRDSCAAMQWEVSIRASS